MLVSGLSWKIEYDYENIALMCLFIFDLCHQCLYSYDGLKWRALNGGKPYPTPSVGKNRLMRDPCVCCSPDGMFHMLWTNCVLFLFGKVAELTNMWLMYCKKSGGWDRFMQWNILSEYVSILDFRTNEGVMCKD